MFKSFILSHKFPLLSLYIIKYSSLVPHSNLHSSLVSDSPVFQYGFLLHFSYIPFLEISTLPRLLLSPCESSLFSILHLFLITRYSSVFQYRSSQFLLYSFPAVDFHKPLIYFLRLHSSSSPLYSVLHLSSSHFSCIPFLLYLSTRHSSAFPSIPHLLVLIK